MTDRQKKYRANRLLGMNMFNAARAAGYSDSMARQACVKIEPAVDFKDVLEQEGVTLKAIAKTYVEALYAYKVISCNILIDKDGNIKNKDADGTTNDFIEVKDWQTRLSAANKLCELLKLNGKGDKEGSASVETFLVELLKKRTEGMKDGEGFRITRVEHSTLDRFMAK